MVPAVRSNPIVWRSVRAHSALPWKDESRVAGTDGTPVRPLSEREKDKERRGRQEERHGRQEGEEQLAEETGEVDLYDGQAHLYDLERRKTRDVII